MEKILANGKNNHRGKKKTTKIVTENEICGGKLDLLAKIHKSQSKCYSNFCIVVECGVLRGSDFSSHPPEHNAAEGKI